MNQPTGTERDCEQAQLLLKEYSFDLSGFSASQLVAIWQERLGADPSWIRAAVLEALYLGRYKAFSVEQILQGWKRRDQPVRHFNSEFERVVFGPIDPAISKYAPMTTLSPSQLMAPQSDDSTAAAASREGTLKDGKTSTPLTDDPALPASKTAEAAAPPEATAAPEAIALPTKLPSLPAETAEPEATGNDCSTEDASQTKASLFNQPEPIQKFTPESKASEFYERLQAVVRKSQ
ncbi:MAG: hypothetical protein AAF892_17480 [Cyanobacteria bacterium P01_D01_bin.71]